MSPRITIALTIPVTAALALAVTALPLRAQESPISNWDLPRETAESIVRMLNDPLVDVREGDVTVDRETRMASDLAIVDGQLRLAGTVDGDVLVVNGDAILDGRTVITGDLTVIGGEVRNASIARIDGEIVTYAEGLAYERSAGRIRLRLGPQISASFDRDGASDFLISTGKSYNRVEGMPIAFGPRLETAGSNPFRIQALAIYRSENGLALDPERMGYFVQAEQFMGGFREYEIGATLHSLVDPIEEWQLTDLESGLATFILHEDFRDHYERQGASVFAEWEPRAAPYRLHVEARWETHQTRSAGNPLSIFDNSEAWRSQPAIAEGHLASAIVEGEFDSRSSSLDPSTGWFARGRIEHGFDADLTRPALVLASGDGLGPLQAHDYGRFLAGMVDLRSYNRINAQSRLNFRVVAGGSLTGDALPPQRQHALGGEGSLPGYSLFSMDCGARSRAVRLASSPTEGPRFFSNYGCDAFTLLQAEFRGKLAFRFRWDAAPWSDDDASSDDVWDFGWELAPDWALFVDAARGWAYDDRPDESTRVDVGAGLLLDPFGLYLGVPVTGGSGIDVFIRLGPRF